MRALAVSIFEDKAIGNCSNHGISTRFKEVLIECPTGPREVDENNLPENFCKIVTRDLGFTVYKHVEPVAKPNGVGWMHGGCIVDTSDSRWHELTGLDYPLHLHDRCESKELYDMLSR
jgi:hypothetical protein